MRLHARPPTPDAGEQQRWRMDLIFRHHVSVAGGHAEWAHSPTLSTILGFEYAQ